MEMNEMLMPRGMDLLDLELIKQTKIVSCVKGGEIPVAEENEMVKTNQTEPLNQQKDEKKEKKS
jgi:hypothetical protein